eukprot:gene13951-16040_t
MDSSVSIANSLKMAKLYEGFKRYEKAVEVYRMLMEQHPRDFRAFFNCARILAFEERTLGEALELFRKVIELNSSIIETYSAVAAILIKLDRPKEASDYCKAGLQVDGSDRNCMYNLSIALRQMGNIEEAIALCWEKLATTVTVPVPSLVGKTDPANCNDSKITIVCVKWGTKYGPEYVNNLYNAVIRCTANSSSFSFRKFVCFTDDASGLHENITCSLFDAATEAWKGWWLKAQVFAPTDLLSGWVLYIDLDTVLCGSLDFIHNLTALGDTSEREQGQDATNFDPRSPIYVLAAETFKNEARQVGMNSSLLLWHTDNHTLQILYRYLENHYGALSNVIYKFDHYLEMMLYKHVYRLESVKPLVLHTPYLANSIANDQYYMSIASFTTQPADVATIADINSAKKEEECTMTEGSPIRCCYFQDYGAGKIVDYFEFVEQERMNAAPGSEDAQTRLSGSSGVLVVAPVAVEPVPVLPAIICFPLKPKPHQLLDEAFVREHWLGEEAVIVSAEVVD